MDTTSNKSSIPAISKRAFLWQMAIYGLSTGILTICLYLLLLPDPTVSNGAFGDMPIFILCFLVSVASTCFSIALFNRVRRGAFFPACEDGKKGLYEVLGPWGAALLGLFAFGLAIGIPFSVKAYIEAGTDNQVPISAVTFILWCAAGVISGLVSLTLQRTKIPA